jgi:hypothetical protein
VEHRSKEDEGAEKDEDEKAKIGRGVKMKGRGGAQNVENTEEHQSGGK